MVKKLLVIGDAKAEPGTVAKGKIPVFEYSEGNTVSLPVMILNGAEDGPILFINANFHGPEIAGSEVIRRLIRDEIDPSTLKGAIIACLCANPLSLQHGHVYGNPRDDMHLQVPGDPLGSTSMRIGNALWTQFCQKVIDNPDTGVVVDIHCTGASAPWAINVTSMSESYADESTVNKGRAFGKAWGWTFQDNPPKPNLPPTPSAWKDILASKGIPCFGTELTDGKRMTGSHVDSAVRGIKNGMKTIGMISGDQEPQTGIKVIEGDWYHDTNLYANRGGYIYYKVHAGEFCPKGTVIAIIKDVYGDIVEEVKMEKDGYFYTFNSFYFSTSDTIGTGDIVAYRFNKR
tara:strand:+ start:197 stop:1231 length:1035 start_codon:yes stop_codon:yes gene_type:complete